MNRQSQDKQNSNEPTLPNEKKTWVKPVLEELEVSKRTKGGSNVTGFESGAFYRTS
ncbi:hypothetical protein MLD52_19670 [Puniceicoccaceae bacterium K14]|nr:hypothetical protein [Puniceicoccaceae bacterium K14]